MTPLLMVKQESVKYIYSAIDRHQLYDLDVDPEERSNQLDNPDYREVHSVLSNLVENRWNNDDLTQAIVASQKRRKFLREALAKGQSHDWDYRPKDELEQHCLRADKVYSQWAYQGMIDYRFPEE